MPIASRKSPDIPPTHRILDPKLGGGGLLDLYVKRIVSAIIKNDNFCSEDPIRSYG